MKGMSEAGIYPQTVLKMVTEKENEETRLDKDMDELKSNRQSSLAGAVLNNQLIESIHKDTLEILDNQSPENLGIFLRHYIERITITGESVDIKFAFRDPPNNCQVLVPGEGIEPTHSFERRILSPLRLPIPPPRPEAKIRLSM
jgi:hypothetical protein